jgi:hypothetical protein
MFHLSDAGLDNGDILLRFIAKKEDWIFPHEYPS